MPWLRRSMASIRGELIHSKRVWESSEAVELATMGWVHWWNTARMHEALGYPYPRGGRSGLHS